MEDAEGVSAEGGVGMAMFDGGLLRRSAVLGSLLWGWLVGGVEVPRWGWQVPERDWGVEGVVAVSLVGSGRSQGGGCFSSKAVALFMCSMGSRRWYSFRSIGVCRCPAGSHVLSLLGYPSHLTRYCNCFPLP